MLHVKMGAASCQGTAQIGGILQGSYSSCQHQQGLGSCSKCVPRPGGMKPVLLAGSPHISAHQTGVEVVVLANSVYHRSFNRMACVLQTKLGALPLSVVACLSAQAYLEVKLLGQDHLQHRSFSTS